LFCKVIAFGELHSVSLEEKNGEVSVANVSDLAEPVIFRNPVASAAARTSLVAVRCANRLWQ